MDDPHPPTGNPVDGAALCAAFVDVLPIEGASILLFGPDGGQSTIGTSSATATRLDSLQFELLEGPHWDVLSTGLPVLCSDLQETPAHVWPLFATAALALGIRSLFSFPMKIGSAVVGAVDLHDHEPRRLDSSELGVATYLANQVAVTAVNLGLRAEHDSESAEHTGAPFLRREVHQATGIVQAQLDISTGDAFARLRAHAFATGLSIETIAKEVVARRLDFSTLDD